MSTYSKMYIAVLDEAPDYMVPTLVAHSVLNAHVKFQDDPRYKDWFDNCFFKVVIKVNKKEFKKILSTLECSKGFERTICNAEPSCLVVMPVSSNDIPAVLKFAKLWKPLTPSI
ncbi:putative endolysin [Salmonella phage vaffelhjerte]|uniref:Putative endolysin n=1 Tax=Salmonella phage vaffelhjerte TaxID=2713325 RepID=A0A6G8RE77_9CAUD|nr:putative endolysin [Salmonella phage vaffelhjerte]